MNCNYCNGDEAVFWQDNMNNAFIDSHGEMLVTAKDRTIRFKVNRCTMCGRKFTEEKYLNLKKGDDIYYVDQENNEIEHGIVFSVAFKDWKVDSFSVDFDCGDFDEFSGGALGKYYFTNKEDAEFSLRNGT
jgi:hypothetical protein